MKTFLAAGDVLINPTLLAYATVETDTEGVRLRLGFSGQAGAPQTEIRLQGLEARSVLKWLRSNAEFLDSGNPTHVAARARTTDPVSPMSDPAKRPVSRALLGAVG